MTINHLVETRLADALLECRNSFAEGRLLRSIVMMIKEENN